MAEELFHPCFVWDFITLVDHEKIQKIVIYLYFSQLGHFGLVHTNISCSMQSMDECHKMSKNVK